MVIVEIKLPFNLCRPGPKESARLSGPAGVSAHREKEQTEAEKEALVPWFMLYQFFKIVRVGQR